MSAKDYIIGSKYTGKHELHVDTRAGIYSESCPPLVRQESHLQAVLLDYADRQARKHPRPVRQVDLPDETVRTKIDAATAVLQQTEAWFKLGDNLQLEQQIQRGNHGNT